MDTTLCLQVKGYRYLEEDNSDESDSEKSMVDDEEHLAEEMGAEDREEGAQGVDSPTARRKGMEVHRRRQQNNHVDEGEREEREGG